jgi:hypothetical protein
MYFRLQDLSVVEPVRWLLSSGERGAPDWPVGGSGWTDLLDYVEANGLSSAFAHKLWQSGPPPPTTAQQRLESLEAKMSTERRLAVDHASEVAEVLERKGIPVYWLKGIAWGESLYGPEAIRPMRDLDLLVPATQLEGTSHELELLGYHPDPLAGPAGQHLPRFVHPSGTKIDVHHRIVPTTIYGFPVNDPKVPWSASNGVVRGDPDRADALFHLAHMVIHVFHHSFYNLRLMHLYDLRLAFAKWKIPPADVVEELSDLMPPRVALDIFGLCDELFDLGGMFRTHPSERFVRAFLRNGSVSLGYPLLRVPRLRSLPGITRYEAMRASFVLREAPGRFGRPVASLHPPA